jgi:hypothetical protein
MWTGLLDSRLIQLLPGRTPLWTPLDKIDDPSLLFTTHEAI